MHPSQLPENDNVHEAEIQDRSRQPDRMYPQPLTSQQRRRIKQ